VLQKVEKNELLIEKLHLLNDPQIAFLILRSCLSYCKMVYFMRTVPYGYLDESAKKFDEVILSALSRLINFKISPSAYSQLSLSVSNGGMGLRKVSDHHPAAFFASIRACLASVRLSTKLVGLRSVKLMTIAEQQISSLISSELVSLRTQAAISDALDKASAQRLFDSSSLSDRARLLSSSAPHAGDFLLCPPIAHQGLKLSPNEWCFAVAYKLGLQVLPSPVSCSANGCNAVMDCQGLHAMRCGTEGDRVVRHNNLRNFFFKECQKALVAPVLEPTNLVRNCGERPADWGIPDFRPGRFMAFDVAITDPTQQAYVVGASSTKSFAADSYAVNVKMAKYSHALSTDPSLMLTPIVAETFGAWNKASYDFIADLSRWLAARDPSSSLSAIRSKLFQRVSVILQRANARMLMSRISTISYNY
jgi:hypothetical protein